MTVSMQVLYSVDSIGLDGRVKKFEKPIFQTWLMFFSMCFAFPLQWAYRWHLHRKWQHSGAIQRPCTVLLQCWTRFILIR